MTESSGGETIDGIPPHVFEAFRVPTTHIAAAESLGNEWDGGVRCGTVVISRVSSASFAAWSAKVRESLHPQGVRLVRPLRSTDGRVVISGYRAHAFVSGQPAQRIDETVAAALRIDDALAGIEIPEWMHRDLPANLSEDDVFALADRAAWADDPTVLLKRGLDESREARGHQVEALTAAAHIHALTRPVSAPNQLAHADMVGTTIFSDTQAPIVTEIIPVARPHGYSAALTMVDGLVADAVDPGILQRFAHIPELTQLLARAVCYRLYIHALHPQARRAITPRLVAVARLVGEEVQRAE